MYQQDPLKLILTKTSYFFNNS